MKLVNGAVAVLGGVLVGFGTQAQAYFPEPEPPHVDGPVRDPIGTIESGKVAPSLEWTLHRTDDGAHPDGREQEMLWLMNRARANPTAEGQFLSATGNSDVNGAITFFSVNLATMRQEFAALASKPPGAFDRRLYAAALAHSQDLIARNAQDHNGQFDRVTTAGFPFSTIYGSVFSYARSPLHAHAGFNIDWGGNDGTGMQTGRGHRRGLMSDTPTVLSLVGISLVPESVAATAVGPLVNTVNYAAIQNTAGNYNRYLVGTAWEDANHNGRFDAGEGKGGVRVSPSAGIFFAITTAAGGYAMPLTASGNLTVTFSGGTLPSPQTRSITVGTTSVLLDLDTAAVVPAGPVRLGGVEFRAGTGQFAFSWSGGTAPYQVQRRLSLKSGTWENFGTETTATNTVVPTSEATGFFRVRGR